MSRRLASRLFVVFLFASPSSNLAAQDTSSVSGNLKVHFLNVGQADAIVVQCPTNEHFMLIDAAELNQKYPGSLTAFKLIVDTLFNTRPKKIHLAVSTHPHSDHTAGMQFILDGYDVVRYLDNGDDYTTKTHEDIRGTVNTQTESNDLEYETLETADPDFVDFCPASNVDVEILAPNDNFDECGDKPNNCSVILRLDYDKTSFLFVGDAEKGLESKLLANKKIRKRINVDVLKVGHHGSNTSSTLAFVKAVSPKIAVVSVGEKAKYSNKGHRHPRKSAIKNLNSVIKTKTYRTEKADAYDDTSKKWVKYSVKQGIYLTSMDKNVTIVSDGKTVWKE